MDILIILAHPDPKSFNHAIAKAVRDALQQDDHTVTLHDLYAEAAALCRSVFSPAS